MPNNAPRSTFKTSAAVQETMKKFPATQQIGFQFNATRQATKEGVTPGKEPPAAQTSGIQQSKSIVADFASNTVEGPPSIVELARALNVDSDGPQYMFEYVYNNIDWEPGWGVQKGDLGCLTDGMGNSFDQSLLLANLLRQAGFTANIVLGTIRLLDTQYEAWWNVPDIWGAQSYCLNEYIPIVTPPTWNGTQYYMDIYHVWVEWVDGSTTYYFDPSMKTYSRKTGLSASSLASALGYVSSTFLSDAESGATIDGSGNFVQNMNRTNVRADLQTYSASLVSYIGSNTIGTAPAGTATVDDVLGGQTIVPVTLPVLNTSLGYEAPGDVPTVWTGDVPSTYKPTLQVQFPNWSNPSVWDFTWSTTSDLLACTRLTLWYSGLLVPSLYLNGTVVATGLAQPTGTNTSIYLTVEHPAYAATNYPQSYQQYYQTTWTWWQTSIYAGDYYLVGNAWGNLGRGQLDYHRPQAAAAQAAGDSATSEALLGEQLAITFFQWAAQNSRVCDLVNRIMSCQTMYNHQIGMISFSDAGDNAQTTDFGGVSGSSDYLPNLSDYATETSINDTVIAMHGVALEAATCAQMNGIAPGYSATQVLDRANRTAIATIAGTVTAGDVLTLTVHDAALSGGVKSDSYTVITGNTLTNIAAGLAAAINGDTSLSAIGVTAASSGATVFLLSTSVNHTSYTSSTSGGATETISIAFAKLYNGTSSNWNSGIDVATILTGNGYTTAETTGVYNSYITYGDTVVIPDHPITTLGSWTGWGYWAYPASGAFGIIDGVIKGGGGQAGDLGDGTSNSNPGNQQLSQPQGGDPIGLFSGDFSYGHDDLVLGSQQAPYNLVFQRFYNSAQQYSTSTLGRGWNHGFNMTAAVSSDGFLAMGDQFAVQGAASIVELFICTDIFSDTTRPVAKLVTATLADSWWIDQLVNNVVAVALPCNTSVFVKQPNGSYTSPARHACTLTLTAGAYSVSTPQKVQYNYNTSGQISTIVYPSGVTITFNYTSGLLTSVSNGMGRTLTLHYTGTLITSVTDGTGRSVSYGYDLNSNLTTFTDANSENTTYSYDNPGRMTEYYLPANPTTAFATNIYDSLSRVKTQANARNQVLTYYFAGSRSEEDDPLGNKRVWYFNRLGATTRFIDPLGLETDWVYDGLNRPIQTTLPEGNQTQLTYDANNNTLTLTKVPKSGSGLSNTVTTYTYDATWAQVKTIEDANLNTTTYNYDPSTGNLLSVDQPIVGGSTPITSMTWNARGQILTQTDPTGSVTKYTYDTITEELTSVIVDYNTGTGHLNLTTQLGYDTVGNLNSITDPNGNQTTIVFDSMRRMTQKTYPTPFNYITNFSYDNNGNLLSVQRQTGGSPAWQTYSSTYSVTNKPLTATDPASKVTSTTYDGKDRLQTQTDAQGREWQSTYDALDRAYQLTDPTSTICATYGYTNNGLLASVMDSRNNTTQVTYDGLDRRSKTTYADSTFEQNSSYDANGNVLTYLTRSGNSITWTYDVLNRLSTKSPFGEPTVTHTYDLAGRLIEVSKPVVSGDPSSGALQLFFDTAGRFYEEEYPDGKTVTHVLDSNGNKTQTTWPDGYYVNRVFDQMNRLTNIKLNGSTSSAVQISYNQLSQRTMLTYGNGASVVYAPQLNEDVTSIAHNFVGSSVVFSYGYDNVHEPVSIGYSDSSYIYHATASSTTYGTADSVNKYPTIGGNTYTYDGNMNLTGDGTWTYGYDTENRLASASKTGVTASFLYDPLDRQTQKTVGSTETRYIYSHWQRIADYNGSSGALLNRYIYGPGIDEPLIAVDSSGNLTYLHADCLGSIIATSNSSGAVTNKNLFGPYGETSSLSGITFGFTGQRYDPELGLYYYKRRYYSPGIGRFLQTDPIGYSSDFNLYTYAKNSPLAYSDPFGESNTLIVVGGILCVVIILGILVNSIQIFYGQDGWVYQLQMWTTKSVTIPLTLWMQSLKQANTDAMKQAEAASKYGTLQQVNGQYQYVSYPGTPSVHTANNQLSNQYNNQYVQIGPAPQFEMSSYDGTQLGMHLGPDGKTMIDDTTGNPVTSISKDGQGHQYSSNFIHSGTVTTSTVIAYATPLYRWYQPPGGG